MKSEWRLVSYVILRTDGRMDGRTKESLEICLAPKNLWVAVTANQPISAGGCAVVALNQKLVVSPRNFDQLSNQQNQ